MLEDYPALLTYAIDELFNHAQLAWELLVSPEPIFVRLREPVAWSRWLALREDELAEPDFTVYLQKKCSNQALIEHCWENCLPKPTKELQFQTSQRPPLAGPQ